MTGPIGGIIPPGVLLTGTNLPLPGQPQPLANVVLASLPPSLLSLDRPLLLEGILVAAPNEDGLARLQTAMGDVVLRVNLPLAQGKNFLLQIPMGQPPQHALLMTPGAQLPATAIGAGMAPPASALAPNQTGQTGQMPLSTGPAPSITPPPATIITPITTLGPARAGVTVPALIYSAGSFGTAPTPSPAQTLPPTAAPTAPGFSLPSLASALGRTLFQRPTESSAPTPVPSTPTTPPATAPAPTPAASGFSPTPLNTQPPQAGQVQIIDLNGPDMPMPTLKDGQIGGTVVQHTPQGQPIIETGTRQIVLQTTTSPPIGSKLSLQIIQQSNTPTTSAPPPPGDIVTDWPALHDATQALSVLNPQQALQLQNSLPALGNNLSTQLVFLLTALRLGDVRALTGESPLRALERIGRKDLADRLEDDFKALANPDYEPVEPGWRGHSLPVNIHGDISMIHFFMRPAPPRVRQEDNPDGEPDPGGTRFLVDLELSQLGPMQIEGRTTPRRLDVLLRTRQMIPAPMQQDLRTLYQSILERQNIKGGLTFQGASEGWLALTPRRHPHGSAPYIA